MSSVQTLALLSLYEGSRGGRGSVLVGGPTGFLSVGLRFGGISTTETSGLVATATSGFGTMAGAVASRKGSFVFNRGLGALSTARWVDFS